MSTADRRHGPYWVPGDDRTYILPGDIKALDAAWDAYLGTRTAPESIDPDTGRAEVDMSPEAVAERARLKARHAEALAFVATYTGSFGLILDLRSGPRWGTKHFRMTPRQVDAVLASRDRDIARQVAREVDEDLWAEEAYALSKETADEAARAAQSPRSATPQDAGLAPQPAPRAPMGEVSDGWYVVDGEPWKVQWNRERTHTYAKRLVDGQWVFVSGGLSTIRQRGERMTVEQAAEYGKLYGVCAVCGRTLTDESSIAAGIGPVCITKL